MADPDLTRLVERLNVLQRFHALRAATPEPLIDPREQKLMQEYSDVLRKAAAAISALTAERDVMAGEAVKATKLHLAQITRAEQAEAKLREIAEIMSGGVDFEDDATESMSKLRRVSKIARSTSQGGEG